MTSSKGKSTTKKKSLKKIPTRDLTIPNCWNDELDNLDINDNNWKCYIAVMEETSLEATPFKEHFNEAAKNGIRLAIKTITLSDIMNFVLKNMTENHPNQDITPLALLSSEIFQYVGKGFKKKIPTSLLAPLIKYMVLDFKQLNIRIREGIIKRYKVYDDYHKSLWQKLDGKPAMKSNTSSKVERKGNESPKNPKLQPKGKLYTKLRKRGEEWMDIKWIDDAPIEGPKLYVVISTLFDADLPLKLISYNIPLVAIVRLKHLETTSLDMKTPYPPSLSDINDILNKIQKLDHMSSPFCSSDFKIDLENKEMIQQFKKEQIVNFWDSINVLKNQSPTALLFKSVMFVDFIPIYSNFSLQLKYFDNEIYQQLSHFLYDLFETAQLHENYLNEMKVTDITDLRCNSQNMEIYSNLLDTVPHEVLTIPFLLDAIIFQVCDMVKVSKEKTETQTTNIASQPQTPTTAKDCFIQLLNSLNIKYDLINEKINSTINLDVHEEQGKDKEIACKCILIFYDNINRITFHLKHDIKELVSKRSIHILKATWEIILQMFFSSDRDYDNFIRLCSEIIKVKEVTGENRLYYYIYLLTVNNILDSILIDVPTPNRTTQRCYSSKYNKSDLCDKCFVQLSEQLISEYPLQNIQEKYYKKSDLCDKCLVELSEQIISKYALQNEQGKYKKSELCDKCLVQICEQLISESSLQNGKRGYKNSEVHAKYFKELTTCSNDSWLENNLSKCSSCSSQTSASVYSFSEEIIASNLFYIEDMSSEILVQTIQSVFHKFNNFKIRYCPFTDQIVLVYHNIWPKLLKEYEQISVGKLTTLVPIRDFVDYILVEEDIGSAITNNQADDLITHDMKNHMRLTTSILQKDLQAKPQKVSIDLEFISHRSLKYTSFTKDRLPSLKSTQATKKSVAQGTRSSNSKSKDKKRVIKEKSKKDKLKEIGKCEETNTMAIGTKEEPTSKNYRFIGYDLGEAMRCQYMENKKDKIMNDGSRFTLIKSSKLYGEQFQTLQITISGHTLYLDCNAFTNNDNAKRSFHVLLSSGILLNFKNIAEDKNKVTDEIDESKTILQDITPIAERIPKQLHLIKHMNYSEIVPSYDLKISTPAGLYLEIINANGLFYIKQQLLSKGPTCKNVLLDNLRCYMDNGSIVKFLIDGKIHILTSNGMFYVINKIIDSPSNNKISDMKLNVAERRHTVDSQSIKTKTRRSLKNILPNIPATELRNVEDPQNTFEEEYHHCIIDYQLTTSDGKQYIFQNGSVEESSNIFMTSNVDIQYNCIRSERLDGMTSVHYADGSLVVRYPDGSQITSIPVEAEELFCEWSPEEMLKWFIGENKDSDSTLYTNPSTVNCLKKTVTSVIQQPNTDITGDSVYKLTSNQLWSNKSIITNDDLCDDCILELFKNKKQNYKDDGFVVFNVSYLMEHPNYSSVQYNISDCEVQLSFPFSTNISLKKDGSYKCSFEEANLLVDCETINFNKLIEQNTIRKTTIFCKPSHNKNPRETEKISVNKNSKRNSAGKRVSNIIHSVDKHQNEIYIDKYFNIHEIFSRDEYNKIEGSDFSCFVINRDLSGFRLVSDEDVNKYTNKVSKNHGLVKKSTNMWSSILTCKPVIKNESEKWLMDYKKSTNDFTEGKQDLREISTFGKLGTWTQPFIKRTIKDPLVLISDHVILRYLHRVPTEASILDSLKIALKRLNKCCKNIGPISIVHDPAKGSLDLTELVNNPILLHNMYKEEMMIIERQNDKFRTNMKSILLKNLINQACIISKNKRQNNKDMEMKAILKKRQIPPYHSSCFGLVHSILDEVFVNVGMERKFSTTLINDRITSIIDELLSPIHEKKLDIDSVGCDEIDGIDKSDNDSILRGILDHVCEVTKTRSCKQLIDRIMDKPLNMITPSDIEVLCTIFDKGTEHCYIQSNENFILQDVLDAGLQLSHYFNSLREMLEFYRCNNNKHGFYIL